MSETILCLDKVPVNLNSEDLKYIFVTEFNDLAFISFYKQFLDMEANDEVKIIPVVIASFGGQVHSLLPMLDIIKSSTKPIATIALGKAMSCGAVLLAAGTPGYRYASENTRIMIHEVTSSNWDKATNLQNDLKETMFLNDLLLSHISKSAKKSKNYIKDQLKKKQNVDWVLSAKEAKFIGLIDHVSVPKLLKK